MTGQRARGRWEMARALELIVTSPGPGFVCDILGFIQAPEDPALPPLENCSGFGPSNGQGLWL